MRAKKSSSAVRTGSAADAVDGRPAKAADLVQNDALCRDVGRSSERLTFLQVSNAFAAASFAVAIGLPLNRFVTINWQMASVVDPVKATGRFLKLARDWLRRCGGASSHIWVQECGRLNGYHIHLLLHVPPSLVRRFSYIQRRWLKGSGAILRKGVIRSRPIGRSYRHALLGCERGDDYRTHLKLTLEYILKETDELSRERYGLRRRPKGGAVYGKRIATSQNIAEAARHRVGWRLADRSSPKLPQRLDSHILTHQLDFAHDFSDLQPAAQKEELGSTCS